MANKAVFEIIVTDKGLKVNQKNIENLGKTVDNTNKKLKDASASSADLYDKQAKGVIGTANSTRSFSKLSQTIGGSNGLVAAYAGLAANAFAVSAAFATLNRVAQAQTLMDGLVEQGARAGRTLTILSQQIKSITKDSISSAEAMQATAQASAAGIQAEDLKRLTTVATEASLALGRDVPDSLNRMVLAVTKMEPELVDELGLTTKITEASERYARQLGISVNSMTQAQKQQALLNAWVEQGTLKFGGLSEAVDANPYNKLKSTFDDLVKTGGNVINFLLKPLVSLLGDSQAALAGFGLVFLGSIRNQIMPGLQEASTSAAKAATAARDASVDALKEQERLGSGRRKSINEFIDASQQGIATQKQFEDAISESNARIESAENRKRPLKPETLEKIKDQELQRQEQLRKIRTENAKAAALQAQADGYAASEGVNLTNAYSKLKDTISAAGVSYRENYAASKTASTGLSGLANTAASSARGIAAAGKVAAIGFLNFLPVIGQVVAAVAILWELLGKDIWAKITGRTEVFSQALDNFNTVIENTSKKIKALEQIERSTASASDRAVAAVSNQSATIYELADAYGAVIQARRESNEIAAKEEENSTRIRDIYKEIAEANKAGNQERARQLEEERKTLMTASRLGVSGQSLAARAFSAQGSEIWMDDEYVAAAQALERLEKVAPGAAEAFYNINGGVEAFNALEPDVKINLVASAFENLGKVARKVEAAFKSIQDAVKNLNSGYIDFIKSLTPTTPYDNIVNNFDALSKSLNDTKLAIMDMEAVGGDASALQERMSETITGIAGPARNIFSAGTREVLNYFDTIDSRLQNSRAELELINKEQDPEKYEQVQDRINSLTAERGQLLEQNSSIIETEVQAYRKIVTDAQVEQITRSGTMAIAQAHLKVLQKQGQVTEQDVEKQMRAENAIIAMQQQQLQVQIRILEADLEREKSALRLLERNQEILENLRKQGQQSRENSIKARQQEISTELGSLGNDPDSLKRKAELNAENVTLSGALANLSREELRNQTEQENIRNSIRVKEAGINALRAEAVALGMQANTNAEILNAKLKKRYENEKQTADLNNQIEESATAILAANRDINNSLLMGANTLQNQITAIKDQINLRRAQLQAEWDFRKRTLEADLNLARARGNQPQVDYYTNLLKLETTRYYTSVDQLDIDERRNIVQVAAIKTLEEELAIKRASLDITQKLTEASNQNLQADFDYMNASNDLIRKRAGMADSEESRAAQAIQAARLAYDLAMAEAVTKKSIIELEFALLKAQRAQQESDLRRRARELRDEAATLAEQEAEREAKRAAAASKEGNAAGDDPNSILVTAPTPTIAPSQRALQQAETLENAANQLGAITADSIDNAMSNATQAIDLQLMTLGVKLQTALEPGPRVTKGITAALSKAFDIVDLYETRLNEARRLRADNNPNNDIADPSKIALATDLVKGYVDSLRESFQALGPEGDLALAIMDSITNISDHTQDLFAKLNEEGATTTTKMAAGFAAAAGVISSVMSILNAASNARLARIDKEIAAEEKRDGKSKESVAKLDAMQKKKDQIARKAFNTNKKLMMAQAVMSTAAGIAATLGDSTLPTVARIALAAVIGGMGLAQLAIIAGTQYESSYTPRSVETPSSLSIGKRSDSVNLAMGPNANAGGEVGYLRGAAGTGTSAANYNTIGSAYGGDLTRGYGNRGFIVGEKGPELITPETPINVTPANDTAASAPVNATINIQAIDSQGVQDVLVAQKGNIIQMLRQAANASGQRFLEDVNVNVYTRPSVGKLL